MAKIMITIIKKRHLHNEGRNSLLSSGMLAFIISDEQDFFRRWMRVFFHGKDM